MRGPLRRFVAILVWSVALGVAFVAGQAGAHARSQSFSSWQLRDGEARLEFTVPALESSR